MLSFPLGRDVLVLQLQRAAVLRWPQVIPLWMTTELLNSLVALKKTANCERMIYSLWRMFFLVTVLPACPFLFVQYRTSNAALQPIAYSCFTLVSIKMPCNNSLQELLYAAIFWQLLYHEMSPTRRARRQCCHCNWIFMLEQSPIPVHHAESTHNTKNSPIDLCTNGGDSS